MTGWSRLEHNGPGVALQKHGRARGARTFLEARESRIAGATQRRNGPRPQHKRNVASPASLRIAPPRRRPPAGGPAVVPQLCFLRPGGAVRRAGPILAHAPSSISGRSAAELPPLPGPLPAPRHCQRGAPLRASSWASSPHRCSGPWRLRPSTPMPASCCSTAATPWWPCCGSPRPSPSASRPRPLCSTAPQPPSHLRSHHPNPTAHGTTIAKTTEPPQPPGTLVCKPVGPVFVVVCVHADLALESKHARASCLFRLLRCFVGSATSIARFRGGGGPGVAGRAPPRGATAARPTLVQVRVLRCRFTFRLFSPLDGRTVHRSARHSSTVSTLTRHLFDIHASLMRHPFDADSALARSLADGFRHKFANIRHDR